MTIDEAIEYGRSLERAAIVERMCYVHFELIYMKNRARSPHKITEWQHHADACKQMAESINDKYHHRDQYLQILEASKHNKPIGKCANELNIEIKV